VTFKLVTHIDIESLNPKRQHGQCGHLAL